MYSTHVHETHTHTHTHKHTHARTYTHTQVYATIYIYPRPGGHLCEGSNIWQYTSTEFCKVLS